MRSIAIVLIGMLVLAGVATAQETSKTAPRRQRPTTTTNPEPEAATLVRDFSGQVFVGERAPDFELETCTGRPTKLSYFRGAWIVLAFADRADDVRPLREQVERFTRMGARVVAVCHEKPRGIRLVGPPDEDNLFTALSDPTGEIAALYGMYDSRHSRTTSGFLVVDRDGMVRLIVLGSSLPPDQVENFARFAMARL
jgi:peroxiredoxin